jgi:hypothetical protein
MVMLPPKSDWKEAPIFPAHESERGGDLVAGQLEAGGDEAVVHDFSDEL